MNLEDCLNARALGSHIQTGLRALGQDRSRVKIRGSRRVSCSVNLDAALQKSFPGASRWDYGVGTVWKGMPEIVWIEVHPATSKDVKTVLGKLAWLKDWLGSFPDPCGRVPSAFYWVATKDVHIDGCRRRRLAAAGLKMPRKVLLL